MKDKSHNQEKSDIKINIHNGSLFIRDIQNNFRLASSLLNLVIVRKYKNSLNLIIIIHKNIMYLLEEIPLILVGMDK